MTPRDVFWFRDLPPELRANIYEHVLVSAKPIHIPNSDIWGNIVARTIDPLRNDTNNLQRAYFLRINDTSILRVSKATRSEATPFLYGRNTFVFHWPTELELFLEHAGSGKRYLRDLRILANDSVANTTTMVEMLRSIPDLQYLTVVIRRALIDVDKFWRIVKMFVDGVTNTGQRNARLDIIRLALQPQRGWFTTKGIFTKGVLGVDIDELCRSGSQASKIWRNEFVEPLARLVDSDAWKRTLVSDESNEQD